MGKLTTYPLGIALTMVLTRLISAADMGGYFLCMSMIMLSSALLQAGLSTTMCKVIASSMAKDHPLAVKKTIRIGAAALAITGSVAFLIITNEPGIWLLGKVEGGENLYDTVIWIACMMVAFAAIGFICEILRGFNDLRSASLLAEQLLQRLLLLMVLLFLFVAGCRLALADVLFMATIAGFLTVSVGIIFIVPKLTSLGNYGSSIRTIDVLREAPTFLMMRLNFWLLNSAAIWILSFFRPLEETALYGAANVLTLLVLAPWHVINSVISPTVVTLHIQGDRTSLETVVRSVAAVAALPALVLSIGLVIFGKSILSIVFTDAYVSGYTVLVLLTLGRSLSTMFGPPMVLLSMTNYQFIVRRVLLIATGLTVGGYIFAADRYGLTGVAIVSASSTCFQGLLLAIAARKTLGVLTIPQFSLTAWERFMRQIGKG